jgi:putative neutral zinc metallopeptidase
LKLRPVWTLIVIAACSSAPGVGPAGSATPPPSTSAGSISPATTAPTPFPIGDDFAALVNLLAGGDEPADSDLDRLWHSVMQHAQPSGVDPYVTPARVVGYRGGSELPQTPCAVNTTLRFWARNARYCSADSSIYYDEGWLREFMSSAGQFAPGAILAHEWGHHIQSLLGISAYQIAEELQADCFAGTYVGSRQGVEGGFFVFSDDELASGLKTFFDIGNSRYSELDWMSPVEHGSRLQRMMAFGTGWLGASGDWGEFGPLVNGYPWCYGYIDFAPGDFATIGPYRVINLPGRDTEQSGATYSIGSETRTGYETSSIRLAWLGDVPESQPTASPEILQSLARELLTNAYPNATSIAAFDVNASSGRGAGWYFERQIDSTNIESGVFAVLLPKLGAGALSIVATRPEPAQTETTKEGLAVIYEHLASVFEVANRLCGPGESGELGVANGSVACMEDQ